MGITRVCVLTALCGVLGGCGDSGHSRLALVPKNAENEPPDVEDKPASDEAIGTENDAHAADGDVAISDHTDSMPEAASVQTSAPAVVTAGETFQAHCTLVDAQGAPLAAAASPEHTPSFEPADA